MQFEFVAALLQKENRETIAKGYDGNERDVLKLKLKKMKKRGPAQIKPVVGAAFSEEQPQVEVTVDVASTQNTEEQMQPISPQTDPTLSLLHKENRTEISQGYGENEPVMHKIKRKKRKKRGSAQTKL